MSQPVNQFQTIELSSAPSLAQAKKSFVMGFPMSPDSAPLYRFFYQLYLQAFTRLGYEFSIKQLPLKRSSLMANNGEVDGEPNRIFAYGETYANMVRVDEPVFINRVVAIANNDEFHVDSWQSLQDSNLYVAHLIGSLRTERELNKVLPKSSIVSNSEVQFSLDQLLAGRVDLYIDLQSRISPNLAQEKYKTLQQVGILVEEFAYPYVHVKHKALAEGLAKVLKQLKQEGIYQQLLTQYLPYVESETIQEKLLD
ncbi:substrate-binding periplasmic protein [Thiomicrorhabdus sediminis]|nr:transporter substrate-binding domain-containing protein [Thiomicrorhabdus sediminis]